MPRPRGRCPSCSADRALTIAGLMPMHRIGTRICPGAGERPNGAPPPPTPTPSAPTGPPPPDEPAGGRSCDAGRCDRPSIGWRRFRTHPDEWLPVCGLHMDGRAGRSRVYDPDRAG